MPGQSLREVFPKELAVATWHQGGAPGRVRSLIHLPQMLAPMAQTVLFEDPAAHPSNEEIQIGVIGFNGRGGSHIRGHQSADGVRVSALCDVDERIWGKGEKSLERAGGSNPKFYHDMRELFENKAIDAVSIATPNHWHALATIWACQAGKDVYVEKPGSWCVVEGRRMIQAARKYGRKVQHGSQSRSSRRIREAIARLHGDAIGKVYMARGLCYKSGGRGWNTRGDLGFRKTEPAPNGLHFDTWLGPAPKQPYHGNLVHYRWHWFWDFGNGDALV